MAQGILSFKYEEDTSKNGMIALRGLPLYLDLAKAARLPEAIEQHLKVRKGSR